MVYKHSFGGICLSEITPLFNNVLESITIIPKNIDYRRESDYSPIYITSSMYRMLQKGEKVVVNKNQVKENYKGSAFSIDGYWYEKRWFNFIGDASQIPNNKSIQDFS